MPYSIRRSGSEYCVYNKETGEKKGCSATRAKATAHMRALYAAENTSASNKSVEPAQAIGSNLQQADFVVEIDRDQDGKPIYAKASSVGLRPQAWDVHAANAEATYVGSMEVWDHQLDPRVVEYDPIGGTNERACANCQWFVSPNACILVRGEISPTGLSQLWKLEEPEVASSLPVQIVGVDEGVKFASSELVVPESNSSIADRAINFANSLFGVQEKAATSPLTLYKIKSIDPTGQEHEQLRFEAHWTNQFEDRGTEIIPEAAHRRMLQWVQESKQYPVLVSWHALGTEYGQVDCMDYNDGFVVAFGYILPGREDIAYKVAAKKDTGMSHGSLYRTDSVTGEIIQYWPFEISDLPRKYAKNPWTEWRLAEVAFSEETKKYLASVGHTPEQISASEQTTSAFAAQLKELGIAYKEDTPPDTAGLMAVMVEMGNKFGEFKEALDGVQSKLTELEPKVEAANASIDERVAAALRPAGVQQATIHAATKSEDNTTPAAPASVGGWNAKSFHDTVFSNVRKPVSEQ